MPYTHDWRSENQDILQWDVHGDIDWGQLHESINNICAELDATAHSVYLMVVNPVGIPNGNPMPHVKTAFTKFGERKNLKGIIVVSDRRVSSFVKPITGLVNKLGKLNMSLTFVTSIDEALDFIAAQQSNLA